VQGCDPGGYRQSQSTVPVNQAQRSVCGDDRGALKCDRRMGKDETPIDYRIIGMYQLIADPSNLFR
jgi:hypothetical protein